MLAVAAVSWAAILIRWCDAPSLAIAFHRLLFATLLLLPWAPAAFRAADARLWLQAGAAGVLLALHFALWISSLEQISVASSVLLVATQPVFTALAAPLLLGERPGRRGVAGLVLALGGMLFLAAGDGEAGNLGHLLAVGGALTGALYLIVGRKLRRRIAFLPYLFMVNLATTLTLLLFALGTGTRLGGFERTTWLLFLLMALGPHLVGHGLLNWSVRRLPALPVNLAILGEPLLSAALAAWLLHERPAAAIYPAAVLIAAGILLSLRDGTAQPAEL